MTRHRPLPDVPLRPVDALMARIDGGAGSAEPIATPSGFPSVDRRLGGGFRADDLVVLGGDVGSGKSALALGMAIRAARAGVPTLYLSGEMSESRLLERALALEGRRSIDELRVGDLGDAARSAVGAAALGLRNLPLLLRPLLGADFGEIDAALDVVPRRRLVVIDSLQLVAPPHPATRADDRVALAARALKGLALAHGTTVLAVAQLPGLDRARPDPRPTLDDLGARGAVKQHADVVLLLYREEMYRPGQGVEGATELLVAKQRNGPTGFVDLYFYPRWLRFEDLLDPEP